MALIPDDSADREARLALAVMDGEATDELQAEDAVRLAAQLEGVQRIMAALDSIEAEQAPAAPPPFPSWGPYLLKEQVGKGSFGVVCRGFDPAVAREIAVKLYSTSDLPSEPRLMARVHHRNVVTVFGAAVHEGRPGIWMEFVRGRTLAERVEAEGPLPLTEVIRIGLELCDALEAVHDAHLVHQDVKARNVMEKDDGGIVLMDFGAGSARRTADEIPDRVAGTPLYMAPEVVLGRAASAQSDIYSLGVLLYYLLTGTHPVNAASWKELGTLFERGHQPTPSRLTAELQEQRPEISRSTARCIGKALAAPDRRYKTAADFRGALETARDSAAHRSPIRGWLIQRSHVFSILVAVAFGVGGGYWLARSRLSPEAVSLTRLTGDAGLATDPAISGDGKLMAYASDRGGNDNLDIWVQRAPGGLPLRLTNDPADESQPSISPDGGHIAFRSERAGGGIYLVPAIGGEPRLIIPEGRHPRFSPDGRHIAYLGGKGWGCLLLVTPVNGGAQQRLAEGAVSPPVWSSDSRHLLFIRSLPERSDWWVARMAEDGKRSATPIRTGAFAELSRFGIDVVTSLPIPSDWANNRLIFSARRGDTSSIWEVTLSHSFTLAGPPKRLTHSTEDQLHPMLAPDGGIVFAARTEIPYLWELPLDADRAHAPSLAPRAVMLISHYPGRGVAAVSADGRWMVVASPLLGRSGIWLKDLETGTERALTTPNADVSEMYPLISRDGTRVIYSAIENGERSIRRVSVDGGIPERICQGCGLPTGWSADERYVSFHLGTPDHSSLAALDTTTGKSVEILTHAQTSLYRGGFSPDGRWIAFHAAKPNGTTQEFIAPFRGLERIEESEWIAVTDGESWTDAPRWSPNGNLLYYVSESDGFRCIWAQPLDSATKRPTGPAIAVYHAHSRRRSIANIHVWGVELSVARDKLIFNMGEARGNIWLAHFR